MSPESKPVALTVAIPTKEEAGSIAEVIGGVHEVCRKIGVPYDVLVVDAGSKDGTQQIAEEAGAKVIIQQRPQYAGAMLDAFEEAQSDFVLTCDADISPLPSRPQK